MRTYELMFVVDPRVSDEDVVGLTQDYRQMINVGGTEITKEENWGRRKLAFPIDKLNEGKYVLFYIQSQDGKTPLAAVEHRMRQNDKILRFLTVRTDLDLKRAGTRVTAVTAAGTGAGDSQAPGGSPTASASPGAETAQGSEAPDTDTAHASESPEVGARGEE